MSCGHQGSMTTVHANSAYDAISRISTLTQLHNQQFSSDHITRAYLTDYDSISSHS
ncbi:ATPase, T2SS/T4P/T4SS family [Pseudoalteromonas shioyasakiensis]|uniref:ATPase, T2SS/T4P/T4SS family n=1 Tax=Pseudoalteromonas shioyasakiensis TaxID=1190813 RepID=UPI0024A63903|nr:ATPase, T2SS/T4P/T4SS family [Pseudoalteromonas shioyasakiensis]